MESTSNIDYAKEIKKLKSQKNAIILAHYYQIGEIQDIADFVGDSLALSQKVQNIDADIILFAGVKFMAETAKILSMSKKVLLPDLNAGCSMADSCQASDFKKFIDDNPGRTVITYVNTTADIKALSDIVCTSSNVLDIVNSLPQNEKILFAPDRNLGNYVKIQTDRDMIMWDGYCHVHEEFSLESIIESKKRYPEAKVLVHPECKANVRLMADHIGSTKDLLDFSKRDAANCFIIATEPGIIHQMKLASPTKQFIPVNSINSSCGCSECNFMKLITMEKIYHCLKDESPEISISKEIADKAVRPILRMLEISSKIGKK